MTSQKLKQRRIRLFFFQPILFGGVYSSNIAGGFFSVFSLTGKSLDFQPSSPFHDVTVRSLESPCQMMKFISNVQQML